MVLLIRSPDGRTTICTASAEAAAAHMARFKAGRRPTATDLNGRRYTLDGLKAHSRAATAALL